MQGNRVVRVIMPFAFLVGLQATACDSDRDLTSEKACEGVTCPVGTTISMEASSLSDCEDKFLDTGSKCHNEGSCVYACTPRAKCCGVEQWSLTTYSCDAPCCANGNPPPCVAPPCGDGNCEAGENHETCPGDCGDTCGDTVCTGGENPTNCPVDCAG